MEPNIQFRKIDKKDLSFLYEVYASTRAEEMRTTGWPQQQIDDFLNMQFYLQHTQYQEHYPNSNFDIILYNGEKIGRFYVDRGKEDILLIDIALLPEYRNKGIGLQLMDALINEAQEKNQPIFLHVEKFNPALNFYHRLGFKIIEDKEVYLYMKWTPTVKEPIKGEQK